MRQAMQFLPMTFLQPLENAKSREAVDSAVEVAQKKLRREFALNAQVAVNRMQMGVLGIPSEVLQKMPADIREGLYELMTVGMEEELFEKHLTARMLGKAKANGAYVQSDSTDIEAVREIAAKEFAFWQAAARDTVKPKTTRQYTMYRTPEGGFKLANIKNRVALYANRLDGTFVEGWADAQPRGTQLVWTLAPAEHCPTCITRSGLGPKPLSFWRERGWFPRDGSTACKTNCMCFFAAATGDTSVLEEPLGEPSRHAWGDLTAWAKDRNSWAGKKLLPAQAKIAKNVNTLTEKMLRAQAATSMDWSRERLDAFFAQHPLGQLGQVPDSDWRTLLNGRGVPNMTAEELQGVRVEAIKRLRQANLLKVEKQAEGQLQEILRPLPLRHFAEWHERGLEVNVKEKASTCGYWTRKDVAAAGKPVKIVTDAESFTHEFTHFLLDETDTATAKQRADDWAELYATRGPFTEKKPISLGFQTDVDDLITPYAGRIYKGQAHGLEYAPEIAREMLNTENSYYVANLARDTQGQLKMAKLWAE